jgi:hypothetical protein
MPETLKRPVRVNRQMTGVPIQLHERTLQPVARVTGWSGSVGTRRGAWLHAVPVEVLVTDADGQTYRVPIEIQKYGGVPWLALAGALVLPLNWLLHRTFARH